MLEAEGLTELETNKGARVPLLEAREVDLLYQMRERLEPLALAESMVRLDETALRPRAGSIPHRRMAGRTRVPPADREFHLLSYCVATWSPSSRPLPGFGTPPSTTGGLTWSLPVPEGTGLSTPNTTSSSLRLRRGDTTDACLSPPSVISAGCVGRAAAPSRRSFGWTKPEPWNTRPMGAASFAAAVA